MGNFDRVRRLPALCGKEFNIEGIGLEESGADVVLSSLGIEHLFNVKAIQFYLMYG